MKTRTYLDYRSFAVELKLSGEGKFRFKFDELVGCSAFALCMRTEKKKKKSFL